MKKLFTYLLILFPFLYVNSDDLNINIGNVKLGNVKTGAQIKFIGKLDDLYLFGSNNPEGIGGSSYFSYQFPTLILINANGEVKNSVDHSDYYSKSSEGEYLFEDQFVFSNRVFITYGIKQKSTNSIKFYIQEIDKNTLQRKNKPIFIASNIYRKYMGVEYTAHATYSLSPDSTMFGICTYLSTDIISNKMASKIALKLDGTSITSASAVVFDQDLKIINKDELIINLEKGEDVKTDGFSIANNGGIYLLTKYYSNDVGGYKTTGSIPNKYRIYTSQNNKWTSKNLEINGNYNMTNAKLTCVENDVLINANFGEFNSKKNINLRGYDIKGLSNFKYDATLTLQYQNSYMYSEKSLDNLDEINSLNKDNYIEYIEVYNKTDNGQLIVTITETTTLILSSFDENGNLKWQRFIDRNMKSALTLSSILIEVGTFYDYKKDLTYIFYPHGYKGNKTMYSIIDNSGNIETKELEFKNLAQEKNIVNGSQWNNEYVFKNYKENFEYGIIKFD